MDFFNFGLKVSACLSVQVITQQRQQFKTQALICYWDQRGSIDWTNKNPDGPKWYSWVFFFPINRVCNNCSEVVYSLSNVVWQAQNTSKVKYDKYVQDTNRLWRKRQLGLSEFTIHNWELVQGGSANGRRQSRLCTQLDGQATSERNEAREVGGATTIQESPKARSTPDNGCEWLAWL